MANIESLVLEDVPEPEPEAPEADEEAPPSPLPVEDEETEDTEDPPPVAEETEGEEADEDPGPEKSVLEAAEFLDSEAAKQVLALKIKGEMVEKPVAEWIREAQQGAGGQAALQEAAQIRKKADEEIGEMTERLGKLEAVEKEVGAFLNRLAQSPEDFIAAFEEWGGGWPGYLDKVAEIRQREKEAVTKGGPADKALVLERRKRREAEQRLRRLEAEAEEQQKQRKAEEEEQQKGTQAAAEQFRTKVMGALDEALPPRTQAQLDQARDKFVELGQALQQEQGRPLSDAQIAEVAKQAAAAVIPPTEEAKPTPPKPPPRSGSTPVSRKRRKKSKPVKPFSEYMRELRDFGEGAP